MSKFWMIRAGVGSKYAQEFAEKECVAIGWTEPGDFTSLDTPDAMRARIEATYARQSAPRRNMAYSHTNKFRNGIAIGDRVVTYDSATREYLLGDVGARCGDRDLQRSQGRPLLARPSG